MVLFWISDGADSTVSEVSMFEQVLNSIQYRAIVIIQRQCLIGIFYAQDVCDNGNSEEAAG